MSLLHDLELPDTCMLVYFFGEIYLIWPFIMAPMIPPECRPRFRFWRRSAVVACSVASAVCNLAKLCGRHTASVRDLLCSQCSAAFESAAYVQCGPVDDVVIRDRPFIFGLFSTQSQSLLVNCVIGFHVQRGRVANQRFHEYRERCILAPATMAVESVRNV